MKAPGDYHDGDGFD
jgi:hypothetical protein